MKGLCFSHFYWLYMFVIGLLGIVVWLTKLELFSKLLVVLPIYVTLSILEFLCVLMLKMQC